MIVQSNNVNICDERPLEYALFNQDPPIPVFRLEFPHEILQHTTLVPISRELLYYPPSDSTSDSPASPFETSVVYMRAGFEASEYVYTSDISGNDSTKSKSNPGITARIHLECSLAIKCPSLLTHLTTFKKIQQALTDPSNLQRFLLPDPPPDLEPQPSFSFQADKQKQSQNRSADRIQKLLNIFMPIHALSSSPSSLSNQLATNPSTAQNYILKPSLEGGGHNIYGIDIPLFLSRLPPREWSSYILMERIKSPENQWSILVSPMGTYEGPVVSELGIFGSCLFRTKTKETEKGEQGYERSVEILENEEIGFSFKTKAWGVQEMSVVKGFGCFDSPLLV